MSSDPVRDFSTSSNTPVLGLKSAGFIVALEAHANVEATYICLTDEIVSADTDITRGQTKLYDVHCCNSQFIASEKSRGGDTAVLYKAMDFFYTQFHSFSRRISSVAN